MRVGNAATGFFLARIGHLGLTGLARNASLSPSDGVVVLILHLLPPYKRKTRLSSHGAQSRQSWSPFLRIIRDCGLHASPIRFSPPRIRAELRDHPALSDPRLHAVAKARRGGGRRHPRAMIERMLATMYAAGHRPGRD